MEPKLLLAQLDLTDSEIDVYLAMLGGALSAREIIQSTGRSRPTVYYALGALERRGLLSKTGLEGAQSYRVEPLKRLQDMLAQRQDELAKTRAEMEQFINQFQATVPGDHKPNVSFYEGVASIRNVIMDTIYCHSRQIDTLVPSQNFFWQLGEEFATSYVRARQNIGTRTRSLWAKSVEREVLDMYYEKSEIRLMPQELGDKFRTTIFIYDDNVLYISSLASGYALLVQSKEHVELMRALYDFVWQGSKTLK